MHAVRLSIGLTCVVSLALASGCAGTQFARSQNAKKLPSDGSLGGPPIETLPVQEMAKNEWEVAPKQKLAPACDGRATPAKADAKLLDPAKAAVAAWTEFKKKTPPPKDVKGPTVGDVIGLERDRTRRVDAFAIDCGPEKAQVTVSGTSYPFDLAWTLSTKPTSTSQAVWFLAFSAKEYKVVFVKLGWGGDPKLGTSDTVIVSNVSSYMPKEMTEPLVRNVGSPQTPRLEALAFAPGAVEGYYWLVPQTDDFAPGSYLGVGRFKVAAQ